MLIEVTIIKNMRIHIDQKKVKRFEKKIKFMLKASRLLKGKSFKPPVDISQGVPEMMQALAMRPDIAKAMMPFSQAVYMNGQVERAIKEKIFVKVSKLNRCQFCTATHTKALESLKLEEEGSNKREKVALEYAEQVTKDANGVTDELFERLKQHFNEGEIIELTLSIGMINLLNKFNDALQIRFRE